MPGHVTRLAIGIFGKLPARADFVRLGLPRDFVDAWDEWLSTVLSATREQAGDAWLPAFLEAPVWRFVLPARFCGSGAVIGLMMPSVDRAGRYFPLTLAAVGEVAEFEIDAAAESWLNRCEDAGLEALEKDATPADIKAMLDIPEVASTAEAGLLAKWWTAGSPRVPPGSMTLTELPSASVYAAMLGMPSPVEELGEARQPINR